MRIKHKNGDLNKIGIQYKDKKCALKKCKKIVGFSELDDYCCQEHWNVDNNSCKYLFRKKIDINMTEHKVCLPELHEIIETAEYDENDDVIREEIVELLDNMENTHRCLDCDKVIKDCNLKYEGGKCK